jgi:two-component system response regulator NreC
MNVGVASTRSLIRKSLCSFVSGIHGVSKALDVKMPFEAPEELRRSALDILVVDSVGPPTDFEILSQLHTLLPNTRILVLTERAGEDYQLQAIRRGAHGFISVYCPPEIFEKALRCVTRGEFWIGHGLATKIIGKFLQREAGNPDNQPELSRREQEILALLAEGYRNKEIASVLGVSENTIRAHATSLYKKINVSSRVEAALYYFRRVQENGDPRHVVTGPHSPQPTGVFAVPSTPPDPASQEAEKAPKRDLPARTMVRTA